MAIPTVPPHRSTAEATRGDAFVELDQLKERLANLVESWARLPELLRNGFTPLADIEETDDAYLVEIELPGVDRNDIDIEVTGPLLYVRGERKERPRVGIVRRRQRGFGPFSYEVVLPGAVRDDAVDATIDAGVLTVRLPKPQQAATKFNDARGG